MRDAYHRDVASLNAHDIQARVEGQHEVEILFLDPEDSHVLVDLVQEVYGDSYDSPWVYEEDEIARRIVAGETKSIIARLTDGTPLGHMALMMGEQRTPVLHAGVAVVTERARGQHLFTRMKKYGADWAQSADFLGIFSEATAAHPYSQKANIDLGAVESGFLLGWIPKSVSNSAAASRTAHRESVALFYLKTNDGPDRPLYAPARHREVISAIVDATGIHGIIQALPSTAHVARSSRIVVHEIDDHNLATVSVLESGQDLAEVLAATRDRLVFQNHRDAVYIDFSLEDPRTEIALEAMDAELPFGFAGVFPNRHTGGDVMRLQSLHNIDIHQDDIATGSDFGRSLLKYVVGDLKRTGANH